MNDFFDTSLFAGVTISLLAYLLGMVLKKKFKLGIFNPLLISIFLTIVVLVVANIDYDTYNQGAVYLSWFLTPATVCLAIPLYEQWQLLKNNLKAVLLGITAGVLTSLCTVLVLAKILHLSHKEFPHHTPDCQRPRPWLLFSCDWNRQSDGTRRNRRCYEQSCHRRHRDYDGITGFVIFAASLILNHYSMPSIFRKCFKRMY